jgi:hypothetical protein
MKKILTLALILTQAIAAHSLGFVVARYDGTWRSGAVTNGFIRITLDADYLAVVERWEGEPGLSPKVDQAYGFFSESRGKRVLSISTGTNGYSANIFKGKVTGTFEDFKTKQTGSFSCVP